MKDKSRVRLPELLAPAGSFIHLKAAFSAGADAVYLGGNQFGARAYAKNFSGEELIDALHYSHFYGRKLYLTVNILMKEEEIERQLDSYLAPLYQAGLDGVIVQDPGVCARIRDWFPDMEIHASTQMTITDVWGARAAKRMGMTRVVPARELSLSEIRKIKEEGIEVEVFVHGALCVSYSGQCLMSSFYGGRSGNRGRCAQPCRLPYQVCNQAGEILSGKRDKTGRFLLSPKDLCALDLLPDLVSAGVDSLKIEGRMKNPEYVAGVTAVYRKYLDQIAGRMSSGQTCQVDPKDRQALEELYSRDGFTSGYFYRKNGPDMMALIHPHNTGRRIGRVLSVRDGRLWMQAETDLHPRDILVIFVSKPSGSDYEELVFTVPAKVIRDREGAVLLNIPSGVQGRTLHKGMPVYRRYNHELTERIRENYIKKEEKLPADAAVTIKKGEPSRLSLSCRGIEITVLGHEGEAARGRPLGKEDIKRQIAKTGSVPFFLKTVAITMDDDVFLPMSVVKKLRQEGFSLLLKKLEEESDRKVLRNRSAKPSEDAAGIRKPAESVEHVKTAVVYNKEILYYILEKGFFDEVCLPMDFLGREDLLSMAEACDRADMQVSLSLKRVFRNNGGKDSRVFEERNWKRFVVHNLNEAEYMTRNFPDAALSCGMSLYQWNLSAVREMMRLFPGIRTGTFPSELSSPEIRQLLNEGRDFFDLQEPEIFLYGRIPLMITAQCVKMTRDTCNHKPEILRLLREDGDSLPVSTHCSSCYNLIWQDRPRDLIGEASGVCAGIRRHLFDLFLASLPEIDDIIKRYDSWARKAFAPGKDRVMDIKWKRGTT